MYCRYLLLLLLLAQSAGAQTVEGVVVDATTGGAIAGARVKLEIGRNSSIDPLYAKTGPDGHFQFAKAPQSGYLLTADAPGYLGPTRCSGERCWLTAYAVISGAVTDPNGVPVPYSEIEILQKAPAGQLAHKLQLQSDDRGRFRAARLGPGTYCVLANRPRALGPWQPTYHATYYPGVSDLASAKPLDLAAGAHAQADIRIVRQEGVRVTGRLTRPESRERTYTQVALAPLDNILSNGDQPSANTTDDRFELTNVLPGKYTLGAVTLLAGDSPWTGTPIFGTLQSIEVGDRDLTGVEVALRPLPDVTGTVTFSQGCKPFPLSIWPRPSVVMFGPPDTVKQAADGTFVLSHLSPGNFRLVVQPPFDVRPVPRISVLLGDRDLNRDGLNVPFAGTEKLRILVDCAGEKGPQ